ncbi:hypothetical protein GOP47_0011452 [Adiantum capillus-veneris]|uniref:Ubiquitin-like protease family profile domain-containing protein n=1 Tax=Adiantum capillus-veneris TaxID=13818 RepID=A0A9D4UT78_ADICA|nr:hypothetical protein GOP47_0011452 [Adiantum capillus-veneris]
MVLTRHPNRYASTLKENLVDGFRQSSNSPLNLVEEMEEDDSPTLMAYSRRSNRYASKVKEDPEDGFRQSSNPGLNPVQEMEEDNSPSSHIDLPQENNYFKCNQDEFRRWWRYCLASEAYELASWDSRIQTREKLVIERVLDGYDKAKRIQTSDFSKGSEKSNSTSKTETTPNASTSQMEIPPAPPQKLKTKRKRDPKAMDGFTQEIHQPIFDDKKSQQSKDETHVAIEIRQGVIDCKSPIPLSPEGTISGGVVFHLKSVRFNLGVDMIGSFQQKLLGSIKSIGYETIEPNAHDCGWYVMKCMRMLIEGGLVGRPPRSWLSKKWFQHEDVEILKEDLREWLAQALGEVPLQKE